MHEQGAMRPWTLADGAALRDDHDLPPIEVGCWVAVAVDHGPGGYSYRDPAPWGVGPQEVKVTEIDGDTFIGEPITMPGVTHVEFGVENIVRVTPLTATRGGDEAVGA